MYFKLELPEELLSTIFCCQWNKSLFRLYNFSSSFQLDYDYSYYLVNISLRINHSTYHQLLEQDFFKETLHLNSTVCNKISFT